MKPVYFDGVVMIVSAVLYLCLGVWIAVERVRYLCNDRGFIQIFDDGYKCDKRSSSYGYPIDRIDK